MPLGPGAYIAEEVLPWIDASGNIVPATGGRAIGTPAPSSGGSPPPPASRPPGGGAPKPAGAQQHPVQPKKATAPHAPVVNVREWREFEDRDEPYSPYRPPSTHAVAVRASRADPTRLLMAHSHARVVPLSPAQIAHGLDEGKPQTAESPKRRRTTTRFPSRSPRDMRAPIKASTTIPGAVSGRLLLAGSTTSRRQGRSKHPSVQAKLCTSISIARSMFVAATAASIPITTFTTRSKRHS